jgi:hypothetical protein
LRFVFAVFGIVGLTSTKSLQPSSSPIAADISATLQEAAATFTGGAMPENNDQASQEEEDRLIDKIGEMVEEAETQKEIYLDDILAEAKHEEEEHPRNPKKRMMEGERDVVRDEL